MAVYTIGIDFGTLSGRAVLVNTQNGEIVAQAKCDYAHGVMDEKLPSGRKLPHEWALQDAMDYLQVLEVTIPKILSESGVSTQDVAGIGIDFTSCTLVACKADGTPLSAIHPDEPHAYVKLWKHHAAQAQADRINQLAQQRGEAWLVRYGGTVSSEWLLPKALQMLEEAPDLYDETDLFIEAADWIVWRLTGNLVRSAGTCGYKALWNKHDGYPDEDFFASLDPRLSDFVQTKLAGDVLPIGSSAGKLQSRMAKKLGLCEGIVVAVGNIDAHVTVPAAGITGTGKLLAIVGTSTCHMITSEREHLVPGICGVVADGILPDLFGYEAGQCCVGDHFAWLVDHMVPQHYFDEAKAQGMDIHAYLTHLADQLSVGQSGLLALDWWNGNRSILVDADLSGMILGMTLRTRAEEIYRALIEATAYGTRVIVENFRAHGVTIDEVIATGGIAKKNSMMMQIYADVLNLPIRIAETDQSGALGSAIFGAVAAGVHRDVYTAVEHMVKPSVTTYSPIRENAECYELLYQEYKTLHDYFGKGGNNVMHRLKQLRDRCRK